MVFAVLAILPVELDTVRIEVERVAVDASHDERLPEDHPAFLVQYGLAVARVVLEQQILLHPGVVTALHGDVLG